MIGSYLLRRIRKAAPEWRPRGWTHPEMELTDFQSVEKKFKEDRPDLIIHCAAMSKTYECQSKPALANAINVEATARLAGMAGDTGFIFFSTDLVFDGTKGDYVETDAVNPLSVYAETKVAAEEIVLRNPRHVVVRTSLNSGRTKNGMAHNEQLLEMWRRGETAKLFVDEFRSPIPAAATARAVWHLAMSCGGGLYHLGGSERLSRVQIGELLAARHPELQARIQPCSLREYAGAPRPADVSLNCAKVQRLLPFQLPKFSRTRI